MGKLKITPPSTSTPRSKKTEPVESWEDEADDGSSSEDDGQATPVLSDDTSSGPPPPTPSSPSMYTGEPYQAFPAHGFDSRFDSDPASSFRRNDASEERRPDKSTSVASRLIAAGIGQKAPKRTKEQREYDQAMKVQEKKKRDQVKEDELRKKQEKDQAMKDVWDG